MSSRRRSLGRRRSLDYATARSLVREGRLEPSDLAEVPFDIIGAVEVETPPDIVYILPIEVFPREEGLEYLIPLVVKRTAGVEERVEVVVSASVYVPGRGWSDWKELWRGRIVAHDGV